MKKHNYWELLGADLFKKAQELYEDAFQPIDELPPPRKIKFLLSRDGNAIAEFESTPDAVGRFSWDRFIAVQGITGKLLWVKIPFNINVGTDTTTIVLHVKKGDVIARID